MLSEQGNPKCLEANSVISMSTSISNMSFKHISIPIPDIGDPPCVSPYYSHYNPSVDSKNTLRHLRHGSHKGHKSGQEEQWQQLEHLFDIVSQEWLDEVESSREDTKMPTHIRRISCQIMGVYGKNMLWSLPLDQHHSSFPCQIFIKEASFSITKVP